MFLDYSFQPKKEDFFEEGPTQFSDLKFTDMNLSRPILKVGMRTFYVGFIAGRIL
jgi:hypothetical protein